MEDRETRDLIARARDGDMDAFAALFERIRPMVFVVATRLVGASDADDVVMETAVKVWKAIPGFSGRSAFRTWVYRLAWNCAMDALRARRRAAERLPADTGEDAGRADDIPDPAARAPDQELASAETGEAIDRALQGVSPELRTTLLLRFADGLSYAEIAAATGVSIGTVMSRLFNGRRKLMARLSSDREAPGPAPGTLATQRNNP